MNRTWIFPLAGSLALWLAATPLMAKEAQLPEVTEDGLHRVQDAKLAIVYAEPGAELSAYRRVKLLDAYVAFRKNWERDQRSSSANPLAITSNDVKRIKEDLATEFHKVFTQVLTEGGYDVVDEADDDVLLVRPAIINLDVTAPDTMSPGRSRSYAASAGEMTLYVELYDSVTGDLIAKAMDRKTDRSNDAFYTWTDRVSNKMAADRILKGWATILVGALDAAKQSSGSEPTGP